MPQFRTEKLSHKCRNLGTMGVDLARFSRTMNGIATKVIFN